MIAVVKRRGVMGGEDVLDERTVVDAGGRVGVDPFRLQAFHLGSAFVDLDVLPILLAR
jgi:hypothetical protein